MVARSEVDPLRSALMSRVRQKDTTPEILTRKALHRLGYRFRLHRKDLPGRPDIVLPRHDAVVFVHGCFWHRHKGCKLAYPVKSNKAFWNKKFADNTRRDREACRKLSELGWNVIVVWECLTRSASKHELGILLESAIRSDRKFIEFPPSNP